MGFFQGLCCLSFSHVFLQYSEPVLIFLTHVSRPAVFLTVLTHRAIMGTGLSCVVVSSLYFTHFKCKRGEESVFLGQNSEFCHLAASPSEAASLFKWPAGLALLSFFPSSLIVFIPQLPLARNISEAHPFQSQTTGASYTAPGEGRWFDSHFTPSVCLAAASGEQVEKGFALRETHMHTQTHAQVVLARGGLPHTFFRFASRLSARRSRPQTQRRC